MRFRLEVLEACGPEPTDQILARQLRMRRAKKAAWEAYLTAAYSCCMFDGTEGNDLKASLTGIGDDNFRSAMAECMACWFFAGSLKFNVIPKPCGRNRKKLDLLVRHNGLEINIEVKAPYWGETVDLNLGIDSERFAQCLKKANTQFSDNSKNILFIAPKYPTKLFKYRDPLVQAFYVVEGISVPMDMQVVSPVGPARVISRPEGKFLKKFREKDGVPCYTRDGIPCHTRVGAVVCVEEFYRESESGVYIDHYCLVLHNPYTKDPIPIDIWPECVQLIPKDDHMEWTDNYLV